VVWQGFEFRDSLKDFFTKLIYNFSDLEQLLQDKDNSVLTYQGLLNNWHSTEYYQWLQENV
jgi:hypothetical protein